MTSPNVRLLFLLPLMAASLLGQELQPRAYFPAPIGLNYLSLSYSHNTGGVLFDPSLPVDNAHVDAHVPTMAVGGSFGAFGRSAQGLAVLPYVSAGFSGQVTGIDQYRHRSGLADTTYRYSMNIYGAPAMHLRDYAKYKPKLVIGASFTMTAPTGQYDPNLLINIGANRWAFRPELGIARYIGNWDFEAQFGAWIYTTNNHYYGGTYRKQDPLGSVQAHVVRFLPRRMWAAFDATFFAGGRSYVGNTIKADYQGNSRLGATLGMALGRRHALRFAFFSGATTRVGADIQSLSVAYQVFWQAGRQ